MTKILTIKTARYEIWKDGKYTERDILIDEEAYSVTEVDKLLKEEEKELREEFPYEEGYCLKQKRIEVHQEIIREEAE